MRVAVTGTPGTGKTTATELVESDLAVVHLNDLIEAEGLTRGVDPDRGAWIADLGAVTDRLAAVNDVLIESHLAHRLPVDRAIVLRCHPDELARRLEARGDPPRKVAENAEAEALDLVLAEAVDALGEGRVYEIDTTGRDPAEVAREIEAVLGGERGPAAGTVSFVDAIEPR